MLSLNPRIGVPEIDFDLSDPTFIPFASTSNKLLKIWKKGQKLLDSFWKMWREDYLMSLRERMQTCLKCGRIRSPFSPQVGDVVILKDDVPRGLWKMGKIVTLIPSSDKEIRSAKVQLASGKVVGRPLNLLYPLECDVDTDETETTGSTKKPSNENRSRRKCAEKAKQKIKEYYNE